MVWKGNLAAVPEQQEAFVDVTAEELVLPLSHHFSDAAVDTTCHRALWDAASTCWAGSGRILILNVISSCDFYWVRTRPSIKA